MNLWREFRRDWTIALLALALIVAGVVGAIVALSGCNPGTRYAAARITWSAAEVADTVGADQYRNLCPAGPYSAEERAECRVRLQRLERLVPLDAGHTRFLSLARLMRVVKDTASAAVIALWAAEEGDPPADLRQRLSCAAAALTALITAFDRLDVPVPVIVQEASDVVVAYAGSARRFALGQCPGVDDATPRQRGATPTPTRDAGAGLQTPAAGGAATDGG